jgi:hypothetical protein
MKLKALRVANAILVGNKTLGYFVDKDYDMVLDGVLIWITCKKTKDKVFTSLFNVPYGEAQPSAETKANTERSPKKKSE